MQSLKRSVKQFIKNIDLFSQNVTFRYNQQTQYQTLTGGFISLILLCSFIGIFFTTFMQTFNRQNINFVVSTVALDDPAELTLPVRQQFMFAIGLAMIDLNKGPRYFDVQLAERIYQTSGRTKTIFPLQKCSYNDWQALGFKKYYKRLDFSRWLCPSFDFQLNMSGKFTSQFFKFYQITIMKCNDSLDVARPCRSQTQIDSFLSANQDFILDFYFINTLINPGKNEYVSQYLQDMNYYAFSLTFGVNANIYISGYSITTDQSLWPFKDVVNINGGIVLQSSEKIDYEVRGNEYSRICLRKSPQDIYIQRSYQGVDDTLSYVGGLFSSILVGMCFVSFYNQFCYELEIAKNIFYFDKNDPLNSDRFNIFTFFIYLVYLGFNKIGIDLFWPTFQRYNRFLQQVRRQMDMRLIMKKIIYSQRLGLAILDKPKYKGLHMQQPITLEDAQVIRKDHRFYKNYRKKYFPNGENANQFQITQQDKQFVRYNQCNSTLMSRSIQKRLNNKVSPLNLDEILQLESSIKKDQSQQNIMVQHTIRNQDEFQQLDKLMKLYILQLKQQVDRGDRVAKRIFDKVDHRIKKRYIKNNYQTKFNMTKSLERLELPANTSKNHLIKRNTIEQQ